MWRGDASTDLMGISTIYWICYIIKTLGSGYTGNNWDIFLIWRFAADDKKNLKNLKGPYLFRTIKFTFDKSLLLSENLEEEEEVVQVSYSTHNQSNIGSACYMTRSVNHPYHSVSFF